MNIPNGNIFDCDLSKNEINAIRFCLDNLNENEPKTFIELGVYCGANIKRVIEEYKDVYCVGIDLFEDFVINNNNTHGSNSCFTIDEVENNIKNLGYDNSRFELHKKDTLVAITELKQTKNCVIFIDANHKYWSCLADFMLIYHKLQDSYIIFHNSSTDGNVDDTYVVVDGGPNRVVKEITSGKYCVQFIKQLDRSAIVRINHELLDNRRYVEYNYKKWEFIRIWSLCRKQFTKTCQRILQQKNTI